MKWQSRLAVCNGFKNTSFIGTSLMPSLRTSSEIAFQHNIVPSSSQTLNTIMLISSSSASKAICSFQTGLNPLLLMIFVFKHFQLITLGLSDVVAKSTSTYGSTISLSPFFLGSQSPDITLTAILMNLEFKDGSPLSPLSRGDLSTYPPYFPPFYSKQQLLRRRFSSLVWKLRATH